MDETYYDRKIRTFFFYCIRVLFVKDTGIVMFRKKIIVLFTILEKIVLFQLKKKILLSITKK